MSIKRIESVYATFWNDERITPTYMSVLQALAYCANGKSKNEDCWPGRGYLARLTHFSDTAIDNACKKLREMGLISWTRVTGDDGEKLSNSYKFLFPHKKMKKRRKSYQQIVDNFLSALATTLPTLPNHVAYPRQPDCLPSPTTLPTLGNDVAINTEEKPQSNTLINSVSEYGRGVGEPTRPMFEFSDVLKKAVYVRPIEMDKDMEDVVMEALEVCGERTDDPDQIRPLVSYLRKMRLADAREEVVTFASEMRQGEHKGLRKPIAELMKRLSLHIPPELQSAASKDISDFGQAMKAASKKR